MGETNLTELGVVLVLVDGAGHEGDGLLALAEPSSQLLQGRLHDLERHAAGLVHVLELLVGRGPHVGRSVSLTHALLCFGVGAGGGQGVGEGTLVKPSSSGYFWAIIVARYCSRFVLLSVDLVSYTASV
jgi:hypothetical protein